MLIDGEIGITDADMEELRRRLQTFAADAEQPAGDPS
jgi:hypothetical protein